MGRRPVLACAFVVAALQAGCADRAAGTRTTPAPDTHTSVPAPVTAMVVGTAHGGHLKVAGYPMTKVEDLILGYAPDLVLVEIRPEAFAARRYEDGPLEMSYVTLAALARGIAVEPIDWWLDGETPDVPDDPVGGPAFEREYGDLARRIDQADTFELLNSEARALDFLRIENARARLGVGEGVAWHRRQSWFHFRAAEAIARHGAHRVAAFVGFAHKPELQMYLRALGLHVVSPTSVAIDHPVTHVPAPVLSFWKEGVARMRARLPGEPPGVRPRLERKLRSWEVAIAHEGACCVDARELEVPAAPSP